MGQRMAGLTQAQVKNLSSLQQFAESIVTERYHSCFQNDNDDNSIQFNSTFVYYCASITALWPIMKLVQNT